MSDGPVSAADRTDDPDANDTRVPERSSGLADPRHPVADPGLEEHVQRPTDVNPAAGRRAELQVTALFTAVPVLAIGFVVAYFAIPQELIVDFGPLHANAQHVVLGLTLGAAILAIGVGAVHWARTLMSDHEMVEMRHPAASSEADRTEVLAKVDAGIDESAITRRRMVGRSLLGALGIIVVPAAVLFADLGPWPTAATRRETIEKTIWEPGVTTAANGTQTTEYRYIVNDVTYQRVRLSDLRIGQLVNAEPENLEDLHGTEYLQAKAKSPLIVVRMDPNRIKIPDSRRDWQVDGVLAYSKICTHVGCPISLWEQQTHHLLCPCHQSTFDLGDSGVVIFGPAARSLPQLPIAVDDEGFLYATSDFTVPVGPSYFERDSRQDYQKGDN